LHAGAAAEALPLLADGTGPEAAALRAEALVALGDTAAAVATLRAENAAPQAAALAWRAGDERLIAAYGTPLQQSLLPTPPEGPAAEFPGPLASGRALVDDSAALRDAIAQVLAAMPAP
jgi:hypothetical protein